MSERTRLELALIQSDVVWHDPAANRARFESQLQQAAGADLVILPEMFSTDFSMPCAELAEPEEGPTSRWLREQAQRIGAVITGSLIIQAADGSYRNRLLPARAIENLCYVAAVNRIGVDGKDHPYSGDSQVLDFQGDTLLYAVDRPGVFRQCLDGAALAAYRERFPADRDADGFALR